jgi:hypothetical protein
MECVRFSLSETETFVSVTVELHSLCFVKLVVRASIKLIICCKLVEAGTAIVGRNVLPVS